MDQRLFAERLRERRKACGYSSREDFAEAYNKRFGQYNPDSPFGGTFGTIKNYENPNYRGNPELSKVVNMCSMLDCDIDYLLGTIDYPKHIHQAMNEECGLSQKATNNLMRWNKWHINLSSMLNVFLESTNFENVLYHAVCLMKVKPALDELREARQKWLCESFSGPPDCGSAYNYTGDNGLTDAISEKEKEYASQRLYLNDHFTFLMQEIEKLSLEKPERKTASKEG